MSDEARDAHLEQMDDDYKRQAADSTVEYWWECPYCGEFVPDGESCTCGEDDDIPY